VELCHLELLLLDGASEHSIRDCCLGGSLAARTGRHRVGIQQFHLAVQLGELLQEFRDLLLLNKHDTFSSSEDRRHVIPATALTLRRSIVDLRYLRLARFFIAGTEAVVDLVALSWCSRL
jgi:hypothetical protein